MTIGSGGKDALTKDGTTQFLFLFKILLPIAAIYFCYATIETYKTNKTYRENAFYSVASLDFRDTYRIQKQDQFIASYHFRTSTGQYVQEAKQKISPSSYRNFQKDTYVAYYQENDQWHSRPIRSFESSASSYLYFVFSLFFLFMVYQKEPQLVFPRILAIFQQDNPLDNGKMFQILMISLIGIFGLYYVSSLSPLADQPSVRPITINKLSVAKDLDCQNYCAIPQDAFSDVLSSEAFFHGLPSEMQAEFTRELEMRKRAKYCKDTCAAYVSSYSFETKDGQEILIDEARIPRSVWVELDRDQPIYAYYHKSNPERHFLAPGGFKPSRF